MKRESKIPYLHAVLGGSKPRLPTRELAKRLREACAKEIHRAPTDEEVLEAFDNALGLLGVHFTGLRAELVEELKDLKRS